MLLAFGEIMLRMTPPRLLRLRQALPGSLDITFGGGEANVCAALAIQGRPARFLTALPANPLAESILANLRGLGVDVDTVLTREGRVGIYFVEEGANQRASSVVYDREQSSISLAGPEEYDLERALAGVDRVHVTGITPAISENAFASTLRLVRMARKHGASVSCDLNYRKKLWRWRVGTKPQVLARECMGQILPEVDLVIGNEEDAEQVLGIHAEGTSVERGRINARAYEGVARGICERFPGVKQVAITLRESLSATHNNWGAMLYDAASGRAFLAPLDSGGEYCPYEIRDIVDRVGAGDSFAAGLLHALDAPDYADPARALAFAVAASCLKHSIRGDFNHVTVAEVQALLAGEASGRVQR